MVVVSHLSRSTLLFTRRKVIVGHCVGVATCLGVVPVESLTSGSRPLRLTICSLMPASDTRSPRHEKHLLGPCSFQHRKGGTRPPGDSKTTSNVILSH